MNSTPEHVPAEGDSPVGEAGAAVAPDETPSEQATSSEQADPDSAVTEAGDVALDAQADPDPALLEARDLALAALREITPEASIGDPAGYRVEADGVVSLRFTNRLAGYPGWFWTVSLARVEDAEPTVLEVELLPGDGALVAPEWVPWAVRLADYHATQAALAEAAQSEPGDVDDETDEDLDDIDDLDAADFDDDGSPILHAGDVDGVDIDELADEPAHDDEDAGADDEDDDSDFDDEEDEDEDSEFDDDEDEDSEPHDEADKDEDSEFDDDNDEDDSYLHDEER